MHKNINYEGHELKYFLTPNSWMNDEEFDSFYKKLEKVNQDSGCNFNYGIFENNADNKSKFSKLLVCIIERDGEPIGFFYNVMIDHSRPFIHLGLVIISHNLGIDLLAGPYIIANLIMHKKIGDFFISNISSTPKIIGGVCETYSDVWPSPFLDQSRPPNNEYKDLAIKLVDQYVKGFFCTDKIKFNPRRFILESPSAEMGFESNLRKLPRHGNMLINVFCQFWIDYSNNEDLVQIGKFDEKSISKYKNLVDLYLK